MSSSPKPTSQEYWIDPLSRIRQCAFFTSTTPVVYHLDVEDFHVLNTAEKRVLFAKGLPSQLAQREKGERILKRLEELAPSIAQHFHVKPDPIDGLTMRLWAQRENPEMREDSYVALSYCLDSEKFPPRKNAEYPLPISPLMFSALAAERGARTTGVWIDQLCIDQKNKDEKAVSVGAMDAVYRNARWVVVALVDVQVHLAQQAFLRDFIKDYEDPSHGFGDTPHKGESPPFFEKHPVLKRFLYTILDSRWFTRAWCSHEMEVGENHLFYMPCQSRTDDGEVTEMFSFTSTFLWDMLTLSAEVPGGNDATSFLRDNISRVFDMRQRVERAMRHLKGEEMVDDGKIQPYTAQIRETFGLGAGGDIDLPPELRRSSANLDKTSIVLNILGTNLSVDRSIDTIVTETDSLRRLMILSLAADDPTILCTMGQHFNFSSAPNSSSWLCKSSYTDLGSGSERRTRLPPLIAPLSRLIQIDQSAELRWIELDVFALGVPRPPAEKHRNLAIDLVQKAIELGMGRSPPGPLGDHAAPYVGKPDMVSKLMTMVIDSVSNEWGPGPQYEYWHSETFFGAWRERFTWTLACGLECGIPWMLSTATKCGYPRPDLLEVTLHALLSRLGEDEDMLAPLEQPNWHTSPNVRWAVNALLRWTNWAVTWGVNRPHGRNAHFRPMLFAHGRRSGGPAGTAMVFIPADAILQVVMPCPLILSEDYARFYRIWLLQARDDPWYEKMYKGERAEWFLRGKAILFTDVEGRDVVASEGSAGDGKPGWRFRRGVRVYGPPDGFVGGGREREGEGEGD